MGCLNSTGQFSHWFGNIHLSGSCNRKCYFCIGQHMMALDSLNNLHSWPLKNIDAFIESCKTHRISEVNITGSNTDPLLYRHTRELHNYLAARIPDFIFGIRTNGVLALARQDIWQLYDKASISIPSFDPAIYKKMMGEADIPDLKKILEVSQGKPIKINIVLGPENVHSGDLFKTIKTLASIGIKKVNLREPYGQPHVGNPLEEYSPERKMLGMPFYNYKGIDVMYWDVHYVEVESVNLYANGVVSETYPVTKGHCPNTGKVLGQEHFQKSGRQQEQWIC